MSGTSSFPNVWKNGLLPRNTSLLEFGNNTLNSLAYFHVVADGLATDCRTKESKGSSVSSGGFGLVGFATTKLVAWLIELCTDKTLPILAEMVAMQHCENESSYVFVNSPSMIDCFSFCRGNQSLLPYMLSVSLHSAPCRFYPKQAPAPPSLTLALQCIVLGRELITADSSFGSIYAVLN